nr:zinc finger protein 883-like [Lytechinus pictus]
MESEKEERSQEGDEVMQVEYVSQSGEATIDVSEISNMDMTQHAASDTGTDVDVEDLTADDATATSNCELNEAASSKAVDEETDADTSGNADTAKNAEMERETSGIDDAVSDLFDEETESVLKTIKIFEFCGEDLVQKDHIEFHGLGAGASDEDEELGSGIESDATDDFDADNPFRCRFCKKTFGYKSNLVRHEKTHSGSKPFICVHCGKAFALQSYLQQHERVHRSNREKPFICYQCGKCYSDKWMLKKHEQSHGDHPDDGPNAYKCQYCDRTFDRIRNVRRHERTHTDTQDTTAYQCPVCHKFFTSFSNFKRHQTTHTEEKPYKCMHCNKSFALLHYLKQHFKTHVEDKDKPRHMCSYCGKVFSENWYLRKHELTHTDNPEFKCKICNKVFSCISNYKRHARVHSGEKPFVCQYCGRAFSESGTLRRHERTHTGNKPFMCKYCGRSFTVSHAMKRHESTHFEEKPYRCTICDRTYTDNSALVRHERTHLEDKKETLVATATIEDANDIMPLTQVVRIVQMSTSQDIQEMAVGAAAHDGHVQVSQPVEAAEYQVIEQVYQASSSGLAPVSVQTVYDSAGLTQYLNSQ